MTFKDFGPASLSRRHAIKTGLAAAATPAILRVIPANAQSLAVKIGIVTPQTGPLAVFGEPVQFVLDQVNRLSGGRVTINDRQVPLQIIAKDSQSNGSRAADVSADLILKDKVNLIIGGGAPDTTNAIADQAEANEVPCINVACPWQPWFFGRKGDPRKGFNWTYLFSFGTEDIHRAFLSLWSSAGVNKVVGGLFANDPDGNGWGQALPPALTAAGYRVIDPGRYQPMSNDFTAQIQAFKAGGVEIVTGTMIPPDFSTFWAQAAQQGFNPKVVTIGKAFLFPAPIAALGARAEGLSCEVAWAPTWPYKSGLTGQSCRELYDAYTAATNKPTPMILGAFHALLEISFDVLKRTKSVTDPKSILAAIADTEYQTINGPVNWKPGKGPVPNVSKPPIVAGQWERKAQGQPLQLATKTNAGWDNIPTDGALKLLA